jgi:hypothetical protein
LIGGKELRKLGRLKAVCGQDWPPHKKVLCRLAGLLLAAALGMNAATYYVTIAGLGGTAEYEAQFQKWAADLDRELRQNGPDAHVETLTGASATRQNIKDLFDRLAHTVASDDAFALFLIGHGTFDGTDYKFNIPGPDITAAELNRFLDQIPAQRQLIVNTTSCSGASLATLVRKDRIVITATKSGTEKNAPVFARYWVDALRDPAADADKNGVVTALEAFRYSQQKVAAYFDSEKLIASEHALFTESDAKAAVRDPSTDNHQGLLAAAFPLMRPEATANALSPEKQKLLAHKQQLEEKIDRLKYQKASLPEQEYKQQLTALLLELARTQAEIDQ